jgi:hypothetical protein|tara:strand:- start:6330 stop:6590 length:261 start_codon:yes stop_codon:yes gene_type:complete
MTDRSDRPMTWTLTAVGVGYEDASGRPDALVWVYGEYEDARKAFDDHVKTWESEGHDVSDVEEEENGDVTCWTDEATLSLEFQDVL